MNTASTELLPNIGLVVKTIPNLTPTRDLEWFQGPLLSEYKDDWGNVYLEKWCTYTEKTYRSIIVRSDENSIKEYLDKKLTMWDLLIFRSGGIGWLYDYTTSETQRVAIVEIRALPEKYLPKYGTTHDPVLAPDWEDPETPSELLDFLEENDYEGKVVESKGTGVKERLEMKCGAIITVYNSGKAIIQGSFKAFEGENLKSLLRAYGLQVK